MISVEDRKLLAGYAEVAERVLDEVARAVGENDDAPRVILHAVRAWAKPYKRAPRGTRAALVDAMRAVGVWCDAFNALGRETYKEREGDPWTHVWRVVLRFREVTLAPRDDLWPGRRYEPFIPMHCARALECIGWTDETAASRVRGEFHGVGWCGTLPNTRLEAA